jgi:hypothetical protein
MINLSCTICRSEIKSSSGTGEVDQNNFSKRDAQ